MVGWPVRKPGAGGSRSCYLASVLASGFFFFSFFGFFLPCGIG